MDTSTTESESQASPVIPRLRQGYEPPEVPVPFLISNDRRLVSDRLVNAVRDVNDETIQHAVKPIKRACKEELSTFCAEDVVLLHRVFKVANANVNSPLMIEAFHNVHGCLATNSNALGTACLDTLVKEYLSGGDWVDVDESRGRKVRSPDPDKHGRHRGKIHQHDEEPDEDNDSDETASPPGTLIYALDTNRDEGIAAASTRIGQSYRHHHRHDRDDVHPFVWMAILPFFCVGVFVSAKRGWGLYQAHRRRATVGKNHCEYVPLQPRDSNVATS